MTTITTLFILGKGGTGKSTTAALIALDLAARGKKTLLVSLDDAHNQSDIFCRPFSHKPSGAAPNLTVIQVDRTREIKRYLKSSADEVRHNFSYLTAFNLEHYFDVLRLSPGMEEYALVTAFETISHQYRGHDVLIADMPPTALSLRFFNLPALSLAWITQLETLRNEIRKKKEIISTIKLGKKEIEQDKILSRIREIKSRYIALNTRFQDKNKSRLVVVSNPDLLSGSETQRIFSDLDALGIPIHTLIRNHRSPRVLDNKDLSWNVPVLDIPYNEQPLIGIEALKQFASARSLTFGHLTAP